VSSVAQLFKLTIGCQGSQHAVVSVAGDLDASRAHELFAAVERLDLHAGQCLDVQLAEVTFVDTVGASILLAIESLAHERGCRYRISSASLQTRAVLELMGLDQLLRATPADGLPDAPPAI
jgi:anti-anti-sigma factor